MISDYLFFYYIILFFLTINFKYNPLLDLKTEKRRVQRHKTTINYEKS